MSQPSPDVPDNTQQQPPARFSDRVWPLPWMGTFLDAMAQIPVATMAARAAQINRTYAYACRKDHPVFAEAWREAEQMAWDLVEGHAIRWSTVGIPIKETRTRSVDGRVVEEVVTESVAVSPSLLKFVLSRGRPEYREGVRVEHTGPGGGPVQVDVEVNRTPTRERMLALAELARQMELPPGVEPVIDHEPGLNGDGG